MAQRKFIIDGGFKTDDASELLANLTMGGSILPNVDSNGTTGYDLGSTTAKWKDLYLSAGSLYVNNQKVLEDDSGTIVVSADVDQGVTIKTTGTGVVTLQSATTVNMAGTLQMGAGKNITDVSGVAVSFGDKIDMNNNNIINVGTAVNATDVANKSYVDTQVSNLVNGAPGAMDTLNELANALGDDANFSATITSSVAANAAALVTTNSTVTNNATQIASNLAAIAANSTEIALKATIAYVDSQDASQLATVLLDATTKADAAQSAAEATAVAADAVVTTAFGNADTVVTTAFQNADATNLVTAASDASMKADSAEVNAINTADLDATTKANAAQSAAEATAVAADAVVTSAFGAADAVVTSAYIAADAVVTSAYIAGDVSTLSSAESYADVTEANAILSAANDATTKANAAQAAAISTAASDATTKADAARTGAVADVTNGAGAAFDTLVEIQNAMATDAELSSAIASVTSSAASTAAADATTKANAALASALAADVTNNNQLTNGAGYITGYTDTNTTYTAGNGMTLTGTSFLMSGSYTGSFTATGDITAYSDDSLKTNVQVIDGALGKVEAIRGVTFERIEDGSVSTGVIAQELKAVLPEAVHTDADGIHSVAYGNITGLLIEAVKELSAQVAELKAK